MKSPFLIAPFLTALCLASDSQGADMRSTLEDQTAVAVTIYNDDLALVKDRRTLQLPAGVSQLAFRGVSAQMQPETAMLRHVSEPDALTVMEQNFDFDLLSPASLLEKYVGKRVQIARTNPATGVETIEEATVLANQGGVVVQFSDRIETNPGGRFIFSDVPSNLRDEPTLSIALNNEAAAPQQVELSYLTGGLGWRADYVAELDADDARLDLLGWVTLTNESGTSYNEASLQLVAGNVNRVQPPATVRRGREVMMMESMDSGVAEESLFEYHLYTLERPTTIQNRQTKQVSLLSAATIPARKQLLLQGSDYYYRSSYGDIGQRLKPGVFVEFDNTDASHLGMPLPKGVVRVYKRDSAGNAQFIGEDAIDHTPRNETVRLKLGEAFDVTADKKQTDFQIRDKILGRDVMESSFAIELRNAQREPVSVVVREPIPGDWTMLRESAPHTKVAAGTAEWTLTVPAEGSVTLTYTTRVKF